MHEAPGARVLPVQPFEPAMKPAPLTWAPSVPVVVPPVLVAVNVTGAERCAATTGANVRAAGVSASFAGAAAAVTVSLRGDASQLFPSDFSLTLRRPSAQATRK